jgi:hypothetical protein
MHKIRFALLFAVVLFGAYVQHREKKTFMMRHKNKVDLNTIDSTRVNDVVFMKRAAGNHPIF